jgi:aminoglycoside phosphotransferase (APT) family kinase protein
MVDGYPPDTPGAPPARLHAIERACVDWRWRLREHADRLATIHGDFHPFNVVFGDGESFRLLDASRGCAGDPADDVTAMAINYVFFALDHAGAWEGGLRLLWRRFFARYLERSGDQALVDVLAPYLAWRGLVVASPAFYPSLPAASRDRLLGFVERALAATRFDPGWADDVLA